MTFAEQLQEASADHRPENIHVVSGQGSRLVSLAEQLQDALEERRGFKIGTKRDRKAGTFIKTSKGWFRFSSKRGKKEKVRQAVSASVEVLKGAIDNGKLKPGMGLGAHIKKAKRLQGEHAKNFNKLLGKLGKLSGPGAKVFGRVKTLESVLGKLVRKPKYGDAGGLQDITGARVIHDTPDQVLATVAKMKEEFDVVNEDDYITNPKSDGYMSYHMTIKDKDGLEKEVQVRTKNQDKMGDWAHDIYKPLNKDQEKAVQKFGDTLNTYATDLWKWHNKKDKGKDPGPKPDCPPVAKKTFGCGPA